jgi:hypothetical protein
MLEELFRKAVQLGQKIATEDNMRFRELLDKARELWTEYDPKPDTSDRMVMGVDSGWNVRLYEGFYVYALRAAAVDERQRVYEPVVEFNRIGGGHSDLTPENYVKYQGEIAEHDVAYKVADDADYVLVDGSLAARLHDARNVLRDKPALNEYFAFARALKGSKNVVFVAKYSRHRFLLQGELGDIYYIARSTRAPGYVLRNTLLGNTQELFGFPITSAYIRLAKYANPLAIEIPSGDVDEEDVKRIMDVLSSRSVMGYPYALYLAHNTVRVTDALMDQLCVAAGLISFSKAREVLSLERGRDNLGRGEA